MLNLKFGLSLAAAATAGYTTYRLIQGQKATARRPARVTEMVESGTEVRVMPETISGSAANSSKTIKLNLSTTTRLAQLALLTTAPTKTSLNNLTPFSNTPKVSDDRFKWTLGLVGAIWGTGLVGHFTRLREWPALYLYVLGTFGLSAYLAKKSKSWKSLYITKENLKPALLWGGLIGGMLFASDVGNTYAFYKRGGAPMKEMEEILIRQKFLYLFPVLIVAEEFLWRGALFSGLLERGMNKHKAIALTTLIYTVNHYAVAPVGMKERSMMAAMAVPIGFANGYITLKTKNLWSGVLVHMLTMASMTADIFIIPKLVKRPKVQPAA